MSRAYRIRVSERMQRVLKAEDHVSSQLELLEILPPDQMAGLLEQELLRRGFEKQGDELVREANGLKVSVDTATGTITVHSELAENVDLEAKREGVADTDWRESGRKKVEDQLRDQLQDDLEKQAEQRSRHLQKQATDQLERALADIQGELDQAINRVTAEALKQKAASLGQIKQLTEDPENGNLTIVLEV